MSNPSQVVPERAEAPQRLLEPAGAEEGDQEPSWGGDHLWGECRE